MAILKRLFGKGTSMGSDQQKDIVADGLDKQQKRITDNNNITNDLMPQEVFCKLLGVEADSLGVKEPISKNTIKLVHKYQSMKHPGLFPMLETPEMQYPQYKITNGKILRGVVFFEDFKLGQVIPALRQYSMTNFANPDDYEVKDMEMQVSEQIYLRIQKLAEIPIIYFCMNLPYLTSKSPSAEGLQSPEMLLQVYKGIENMLFEIYEELGEGEYVTATIVLQKIKSILDVKKLNIPNEWLDKTNQILA